MPRTAYSALIKSKKKSEMTAGDMEHRERIVGELKIWGLELMICVVHLRINLIPLGHVATHCVHWRGELQVHLLDGIICFSPALRCGVRLFKSPLDRFGLLW